MKNLTFIILTIMLGFSSCSDTKNSNQLDSDEFETKEERIDILKNEIISKSDFDDAEFELFNVNGFSNSRTIVPGASSWDYKFAIKVNSSNLDKWTEGMIKIELEDYNDGWTTEIIIKRKSNWNTQSQPEYYTRNGDNVTMIVFRNEGIIFKRVINT